jgi:hypothetical protein
MLAFLTETQKPCSLLSFQKREQGFEIQARVREAIPARSYFAGAGVALSLGVERYPVIWFLFTSKTTIS